MKIKSAYNQERKKHDSALFFLDEDGECLPSRTKQSHKLECDINHIIKKYDKHKVLTHVNTAIAMYGDFTETHEYQDAQNLISVSDSNFSQIPAPIRRRFGDNAGEFLEFATNPENLDEMVKLGLAVKPSPEKEIIQKVEIIETKPLETPTS